MDPWHKKSIIQSDSVSAGDDLKNIVKAARMTKKRKEVQDSLLFGTSSKGRTKLIRACDDVSILHTSRNGDPIEAVEADETYDEVYEREAGQSVPKSVDLKDKFKRNYESCILRSKSSSHFRT